MKTIFFPVFSLVIAAIVFNYALCLTLIVMQTIHWDPNNSVLAGLSAFILPALATGMMLTHVKPFFKPCLTAPLGSMSVMSILVISDSKASIGAQLGFITIVVVFTLLGCATTKLLQRRQRPQPPTTNNCKVPTASPV